MTEADRAYLAGFFDGEGSLFIVRRKRRKIFSYDMVISLTNTDIVLLKSFRDQLGFGYVHLKHHDNGKWKTAGQLLIRERSEQVRFIDLVRPYIRSKKHQLLYGEFFLTTRCVSRGQRLKPGHDDLREICWREIPGSNQRGPRQLFLQLAAS